MSPKNTYNHLLRRFWQTISMVSEKGGPVNCTDMIFAVCQAVDKYSEHRTKAFLVLYGLREAFESIPRDVLWLVLHTRGVSTKLLWFSASFTRS